MARPTITTRPCETTETRHVTELLYDDGENDDTLVLALHGGDVEPGTAETAVELASRLSDATCWARLGYDDGGAFEAWHPPSKQIGPADHPLLAEVAGRGFDTVLSLHGRADEEVVVGGRADSAARRTVRNRLDDALPVPVRTAADGPYAGVHLENPVNRLAAGEGGIQLELAPSARGEHAGAVRETLADLVAAERF
ncbi:poly-gamma-glutamate hydrolase family protein [Salinirussus salinus]|uniref:poly-gamma-glutamate hydrolase family protein n=1 Tax=Salinirussus salinus TaxID=1198300 RepID=UPI00135A956D|nr:poly-gamma-glutamate hydrolase family protein [Salinirussus salinus]